MRPRLLDLYCSAGGAGMGYHFAGFDVVGVDIRPQPRYPFEFIQADVLGLDPDFIRSFDAIHASPPCQAHTSMKTMHNALDHADLVPQTRAMLIASGRPWVIENVVGAPLEAPIMLCGTMFRLGIDDADLLRHRLFEMSHPPVFVPACQHSNRATIGVYGEGARDSRRKFDKGVPDFTTEQARIAMGIDWMTIAELCQAIPPAYTNFIGKHLMATMFAEKAQPPLFAAATDLLEELAASTAEMMAVRVRLEDAGLSNLVGGIARQCDMNRDAIAKAHGKAA